MGSLLPRVSTRLLAVALLAFAWLVPAGAVAIAAPLETAHFRFHPAEGTERNAARLARDAEERFQRLCADLGACDSLDGPIEVWLARDAEGFAKAFPDGSPMAEWAIGVAFTDQQRIVLRAHGSALFSLHETFEHEVSHVLLYAVADGRPVPRWFSEGVAIWQAGEAVLQRLVDAQRAAMTDNLLTLDEIERRFPARGASVTLAYAQAALFVHWLEQRHGDEALPALLSRIGRGTDFHPAFEATFGAPVDALEEAWRETITRGSGGATLLSDPNLMWVLMSFLFLWAAGLTWKRRRDALAAMAEQEAASDADLWPEAEESPTFH